MVSVTANKNILAANELIPIEKINSTSKALIEYIGRYNVRDDREADMMSTRWNIFTFTHQIPLTDTKEMPCVSTLLH